MGFSGYLTQYTKICIGSLKNILYILFNSYSRIIYKQLWPSGMASRLSNF